jgi:hypothetical protein
LIEQALDILNIGLMENDRVAVLDWNIHTKISSEPIINFSSIDYSVILYSILYSCNGISYEYTKCKIFRLLPKSYSHFKIPIKPTES